MTANQPRILYPERLEQARLIRGKSRQEIADVFEVTRQAVSQYENGTCKPKPEILRQYQEYLDIPLNFFYTQPIEKTNTAINFRKLQKSTDVEQGRTTTRLEFMAEVYAYLKEYIEFPGVNIPYHNESEHYTEAEIETIASQVRREWKLGRSPIPNMALVMESFGCIISKFHSQGDTDIDGCSKIYDIQGEARPFIAMISRRNSTACRERFSLAHELGHIILHSWADPDYTRNKEELKRMEHEANYFAGAFLLPLEEFSHEAMSCSALDSFIALKNRWKVSVAAMIQRALSIALISENQLKYLYKQLNMRGFKKNEPLDDIIPHDDPQNLNNAINLLIKNGICSENEILEDIPFPVGEMVQICGFSQENSPFSFKRYQQPNLRVI